MFPFVLMLHLQLNGNSWHWVNTKAGMTFQNRSKQSSLHYHFSWLFFFEHKKELHIFIARNSISANKKIGNSELFGCSFLYYKKKMILRQLLNCANYTIQRKISVVFFYKLLYQRYVYSWLYPMIDEAMSCRCSYRQTSSPPYFYST